ncbi:MAG: hypothetical protein OES84_06210, partial [Kiritimatiellaceae bacterium]|nr:hypothetical protein [Kiritimatiellaceae bacterium]
MNTETHRSNYKKLAPSRIVPWLLLPVILAGCKPEKPKIYPQNQLTIEYSVDQDSILIGDPVELVVTAYFPTNGTLE